MGKSSIAKSAEKPPQSPTVEATGGSSVLGDNLRRIRTRMGLTLAQVSKRCNIAHSSLWKVENRQMSLTYDKLVQLAKGLQIGIGELFSSNAPTLASGRRALTRRDEGMVQRTGHGVYRYPCTDISNRRMTPMIVEILDDNLEAFGPWSRHQGEEYVYVMLGPVVFASEFYQPLELSTGDSLYYDSSMGHAFLRAGPEPAQILSVCIGDSPTPS